MKKRILAFACAALLLISISGCGTKNNNTTIEYTGDAILDGAVDFAVQDSYALEPETLNVWLTDEGQEALNAAESKQPLEVNFIRAYLALSEFNYDAAAGYFRECLKCDYNKDNMDVMAKTYYEIARIELANGNDQEAYDYIDKIEEVYDGSNTRNVQIYIYTLWIYDILESPGGLDEAIELVEKTVTIAEKYGFVNMAYIYYEVAFVYSYSDIYTNKVAEYNLKALDVATENGDVYWIATVSADIGANYYTEGNYPKALEYMTIAYEKLAEANAKENYLYIGTEIYIADIISRIYLDLNDVEKSEKFSKIVDNLLEKEEESKQKQDNITKHYTTLAEIESYKGNYDKALEYLDMAKERYEAEDYFYYTNFDIVLCEQYGKVYEGLKDYETAADYYEKAITDYEAKASTYMEPSTIESMYRIKYAQGKYDEANEYAERLIGIVDYFNDGSKHDNSMLIEEFEAGERDAQIELLRIKNQNLKHLIGSSVFLVGIALYFVFFSIRSSREIKRLNEKLTDASLKDELTGLNNRRSLNKYLEEHWEEICTGHSDISVVMLDVDFFKKYNDYYGHQAGDRVLADIAAVLKEKSNKNAFVSRYGGEEFLIIMPYACREEAEERMQAIRADIESLGIEHAKSSVSPYVTISVGIATTDTHKSYMEMIHYADNALYDAKKTRNTIITTGCSEILA